MNGVCAVRVLSDPVIHTGGTEYIVCDRHQAWMGHLQADFQRSNPVLSLSKSFKDVSLQPFHNPRRH